MSFVNELSINRYAKLFKTLELNPKMVKKNALYTIVDDVFMQIPELAKAEARLRDKSVRISWRNKDSNEPSGNVTILTPDDKTLLIKLFTTVRGTYEGNLARTWKLVNANLGQIYLSRATTAISYSDPSLKSGFIHQWYEHLWYDEKGLNTALHHVDTFIGKAREMKYYELVGKANRADFVTSTPICEFMISNQGTFTAKGPMTNDVRKQSIALDGDLMPKRSSKLAHLSLEEKETLLLKERDQLNLLILMGLINKERVAPYEEFEETKHVKKKTK